VRLQRDKASLFKAWFSDDSVVLHLSKTSMRCLNLQCYVWQCRLGTFRDCVVIEAWQVRAPGYDDAQHHAEQGCRRLMRR
jgi:hypothetical protein